MPQHNELQTRLLSMMRWFHGFCVEHSLRYYVIGGTMLGAVRHKGFIPWDDDIDVGMPREDYDRLCSLLRKEKAPYVLETPEDGAKDFPYLYGKLYDPTTTMVEKKRKTVVRGIFLDIFPLDGLGNSEEAKNLHYKKIKSLIDLHLTMVCALRKGRSWKKNAAVLLARLIPGFILSPRKVAAKLEALRRQYTFDGSAYISNTAGAWGAKENFPREVFGTPTLYAFEDMEVFGPEQFDAYLSGMYGDYMTPPPKEKQVSHHDFISYDLNKSYQEARS